MAVALRPEQLALLRGLRNPYVAACTLMVRSPQLLADGTFRNIRAVTRQFTEWLMAQPGSLDPWDESHFVKWLRAKQIAQTTRLTYLKNYLQIRTWSLASPLTIMRTELLNSGAMIPLRQAPPMPKALLDDPLLTPDPHKRMQLWFAWKTASRWGDLVNLKVSDFLVYNGHTLIVDWSTKTKSSKRRPFRATRYTVIQGSRTGPLIRWVLGLKDPIKWMTTSEVSGLLQKSQPDLSAHSIKVGATQALEWGC